MASDETTEFLAELYNQAAKDDESPKETAQRINKNLRGLSRRDLMKASGGVGLGALLGGGSIAATQTGAADPSTSDSDGNVGLPGDRVDVFSDGIDANSIETEQLLNRSLPVRVYQDGSETVAETASQEFRNSDAAQVVRSVLDSLGDGVEFKFQPGEYPWETAIAIQETNIHIHGTVSWEQGGTSGSGAQIYANSAISHFISFGNHFNTVHDIGFSGGGNVGSAAIINNGRDNQIGPRVGIRNTNRGVEVKNINCWIFNNWIEIMQGDGVRVNPDSSSYNDLYIIDNLFYDNTNDVAVSADFGWIKMRGNRAVESEHFFNIFGGQLDHVIARDNTHRGHSGRAYRIGSDVTHFKIFGDSLDGESTTENFLTTTSGSTTDGDCKAVDVTAENITGSMFVEDGGGWAKRQTSGYVVENTGPETQSGDGSTATFQIPHGLDETPTARNVWPESEDAAGDWWVSGVGSTNIELTYASAPPSGTDNLTWGFEASVGAN